MNLASLNNDQLLNRLYTMAFKEVTLAGKQGMAAENKRAELVREAHKRGLLGMKSKYKFRREK